VGYATGVRSNEFRMDQPELNTELSEPSAPMVGAATGFHRDHLGRELDHGLYQLAPADPPRNDRPTMGIDAMQLEHPLRQVDPQNRYCHPATLLLSAPPAWRIGREASIP
jgi:hypothetical protein